ncbi:MAG: hypothetical protein WAL98_18675 [Desulfatiglandaceae bacterium]
MGTMMTSNEVVSSAEVNEPGVRLFFRPFLIVHLALGFRKGLKKSLRFGSSSQLIGCRSRHKPAFYEVINSSRTSKTNRAGHSAIPPPKAMATAVASRISSFVAPKSAALLT